MGQEISQRLDANNCEWEQCKEFVKDLVQWTMEVCKLSQRFLHGIEISMVSGISVAFRSIVPW